MLENPVITLTTDFGLRDPFVGTMKGVILGINPVSRIVDISHDIPSQDVREASLVIAMSYQYFPPGSIHVVVVDPGVGGSRQPLLIITKDYYFIGPDNGVFSRILGKENVSGLIHITATEYFLDRKGSTFHGRDIFAPIAAWLSKGIDVFSFGEKIDDCVTISTPEVRTRSDGVLEGEVLYIDRFGNAASTITGHDIENVCRRSAGRSCRITFRDDEIPLREYYAEEHGNRLAAVINGFGFLELFIYKGNASEQFSIAKGERVRVSTA